MGGVDEAELHHPGHEEVPEFGIGDVVEVGRVREHKVDALVGDVAQCARVAVADVPGLGPVRGNLLHQAGQGRLDALLERSRRPHGGAHRVRESPPPVVLQPGVDLDRPGDVAVGAYREQRRQPAPAAGVPAHHVVRLQVVGERDRHGLTDGCVLDPHDLVRQDGQMQLLPGVEQVRVVGVPVPQQPIVGSPVLRDDRARRRKRPGGDEVTELVRCPLVRPQVRAGRAPDSPFAVRVLALLAGRDRLDGENPEARRPTRSALSMSRSECPQVGQTAAP